MQEHGSRVVKRRLTEVGGVATKSAAGVNLLRSALLGLGGALVLTSAVRQIASFEQAMSTVRAVSGATESQWKSLTETARELGATTRFTATQAAEGMVELARAGFEVSEVLESVDDTLMLAQAGALGLAQAAEITVSALRGFRLDADQAGRVTDVLAFAANDASTDVYQLGDALRYVAPIAAGTGVDIEEVVSAISALSDAGLRGTLAGTGLRRTLSELESPSGKTRRILKNLGLTVSDVKISSVGLTAALIKLKEAGVNTGLAFELFGDRGGPAFEVLSTSIPKIVEGTKELKNAGGTAKMVADIMDDNLNGALLRVKSAWEAVQLSFGEMGASSLLTNILEGIANALRFLADHIEIVNGALIAITITAIPKLIAALSALTPMLGLLALGAGIGALVAFRYEIKASEDSVASLGDVASATWERIKSGASTLYDTIRSQFPGLGDVMTKMFGDLDVSLEGFLTGAARVLDRYVGFWRAVINVIVALYEGLGPALQEMTVDIVNDMITTMDSGFRKFYELLGRIPGRVGQPYRRLAEEGVIPRLNQMAEGATERLKSSIVDGFAAGFDEITVFEDSVNAVFDRADEIAKKRLAEQSAEILEAGAAGPLAAPTGGGAPTPQGQQLGFQQALTNLNRQVELLRMSNSEREVQNELLKAENQLRELGVELDESQRERLTTELTRLQLIRQVSEAIDEVRGAEIDLTAAQRELSAQVEAGNITLDEATKALQLLRGQVNQTATTIDAGFHRGLSSIWREINDFATQTENTLVNAFHSAEDALVEFTKTCKMDFKSMVDSILGDLTRLMARMLLVKAIEAIGGSSNPIATVFGGGRAGGGEVYPGTVYEVGEEGKELFAPRTAGQIISNERIQKAVGAEGQPEGDRDEGAVTVIVVDSMEKALAAMETAEGKRIIVNTVGESKRELG